DAFGRAGEYANGELRLQELSLFPRLLLVALPFPARAFAARAVFAVDEIARVQHSLERRPHARSRTRRLRVQDQGGQGAPHRVRRPAKQISALTTFEEEPLE